jgi:uncharacterized membrane protein
MPEGDLRMANAVENSKDHGTNGVSITLNGRYLAPPKDGDGKIWVRTSALVQGGAPELYEVWRNVENAPLWQEQIESVASTGDKTSHWVMRRGRESDEKVEWDSELIAEEPGQRLAWRSVGGDSENAGEVTFEPAPSGEAVIVTWLQEFKMGKLTSAWETLVGRSPKQAVIENLRHFKALVETGEIPRTTGQPHGPRGVIAGFKAAVYGEKVETPPGLNQKAS